MNHLDAKRARLARKKCGAIDAPGLFFCPPEGLYLLGVLFDLELAQDGVPGDVNFVPLAFQAAERAFVHFAEVAQRRGVADERVDFLARGRGDLDGGVNQLRSPAR